MGRLRMAAAGAALALAAGSLAACGGGTAEEASSSAAPSSSPVQSQGSGQLPAGWPPEVPPLPGFSVMSSAKSGDTFTAQFQAPGDQAQAVKDYAIWLQNNGWAIDAQIPPGTNGMWGFRAFGYSLTMLSTDFGDQTVVSVNIQPV